MSHETSSDINAFWGTPILEYHQVVKLIALTHWALMAATAEIVNACGSTFSHNKSFKSKVEMFPVILPALCHHFDLVIFHVRSGFSLARTGYNKMCLKDINNSKRLWAWSLNSCTSSACCCDVGKLQWGIRLITQYPAESRKYGEIAEWIQRGEEHRIQVQKRGEG